MELQQANDKYLVYKDRIEQPDDSKVPALHSDKTKWFWNDRIALTQGKHTDESWHFQAFDLLTNESRLISFPKSDIQFDSVQVFPLVNNYGFITEELDGRYQFSLVRIHWKTNEIQVFERFERQYEYEDEIRILVDKLQPSKFVLALDFTYEVCKLNDDGKIEFGDIHSTSFYFEHYSNDKLFLFGYGDEADFAIYTHDLLLKKSQSFQIETLPGYDVSVSKIEWVKNRVYSVVRNEDQFGIACVDSETKRLTLLDLTTTVPIQKLQIFNGKLIAYAKDSEKQNDIVTSTVEVHSIPIHFPHSLRQMVYLLVVQKMKNSGVADPYKAVTCYLPLTTDIRAPWFTDKADDETTDGQGNLDAKDETSGSVEEAIPVKRRKPN